MRAMSASRQVGTGRRATGIVVQRWDDTCSLAVECMAAGGQVALTEAWAAVSRWKPTGRWVAIGHTGSERTQQQQWHLGADSLEAEPRVLPEEQGPWAVACLAALSPLGSNVQHAQGCSVLEAIWTCSLPPSPSFCHVCAPGPSLAPCARPQPQAGAPAH